MSDDELVRFTAGHAGAAGAGAQAELSKRLSTAVRKLSIETQASGQTMKRLTMWLVVLTVVITLCTIVLTVR